MSGPELKAVRPPPSEIADPTPFDEPWQAQAFAIVVGLHERGLFDWSEWAEALSAELKRPGAAEDASDYYACWLQALVNLIGKKQIAESAEIEALAAAWSRAAQATPHGKPIPLENDPLSS